MRRPTPTSAWIAREVRCGTPPPVVEGHARVRQVRPFNGRIADRASGTLRCPTPRLLGLQPRPSPHRSRLRPERAVSHLSEKHAEGQDIDAVLCAERAIANVDEDPPHQARKIGDGAEAEELPG